MPGLTDTELKNKLDHVTGSTAASYLGQSPYKRPSHAWEENNGLRTFVENDDTVGGNVFEEAIGKMALHKLGIPEEEAHKPTTIYHPSMPETFLVHCDLLVPSQKLGIQIKNHWPWVRKSYLPRPKDPNWKWDNELVPVHTRMQCLLEQDVVSCKYQEEWTWCLAAYFGGQYPEIYWIARQRKLMTAMWQAGIYFWDKHLDPFGPKERPDDSTWVGPARKYVKRPPKPNAEEIQAAPVPFGVPEEPLELKIPFGEE